MQEHRFTVLNRNLRLTMLNHMSNQDILIGHAHYILQLTRPPISWSQVRQEKIPIIQFFLIFSSSMLGNCPLNIYFEMEFLFYFFLFSNMNLQAYFIFYFFSFPTSQKSVCQDLSTEEYSECDLISMSHFAHLHIFTSS